MHLKLIISAGCNQGYRKRDGRNMGHVISSWHLVVTMAHVVRHGSAIAWLSSWSLTGSPSTKQLAQLETGQLQMSRL